MLTPEQSERVAKEMENIEKALLSKDVVMGTNNDDALARLAMYIGPALPNLAHALFCGKEAIRIVKDVQRNDVTSKLKPKGWTAEEVHPLINTYDTNYTPEAKNLVEGTQVCERSPSCKCWYDSVEDTGRTLCMFCGEPHERGV